MKLDRIFLATIISLFCSTAYSQDGWFTSAAPPIIFRFVEGGVNFTNTSDKIIYGITINSTRDGRKSSIVAVDSIEPHKTVFAHGPALDGMFFDGTITCKDYSKPLKVFP